MNILQVGWEGLNRSGVPKIIMDITRNMSNYNDIDLVLFTKEKKYYDDEFLNYGGKIYRIPKYGGKNKFIKKANYYLRGPKIFFGMLKILKNKKYDVIHCHNEYESGLCILAAFFAGVKIRISHLHNAEYKSGRKNIFNVPYNGMLKFFLCRFSTHIICCSENTKKDFFDNNKYEYKTTVVLNSIDLKKYDCNLKKKEKNNKYIMSHIGKFSYKKNQMFILNLMPEMIKRIPNIELHLIGFGEEYKIKLEKKIEELKINRYVKILAPESDIVEELSQTDLFIFPSVTEGLGIVLFEAQAMGVPCLASDTVSRETDLGMIMYKSIKDDMSEWVYEVQKIHDGEIKFEINKEKLKMRDNLCYIKKIEKIYKGEIV